MYEHVLSPISVGGVEIPNRVVRTAHATGIGGDDGQLGGRFQHGFSLGIGDLKAV